MNKISDQLSIVMNPSAYSSEEFLGALTQLDEYSKNAELPPKLRHYLEKRSYEKAMAFLADPESGKKC